MPAQIDLTTVVAILSSIIAIGVAAYSGIAKFALDRELKARDEAHRKLEKKLEDETKAREQTDRECIQDTKKYVERLHANDVETAKLLGEIALLRQADTNHLADLGSMKNEMVTKAEFKHLESMLERLISQFDRQSRSPGIYAPRYTPASGTPSDPPKHR